MAEIRDDALLLRRIPFSDTSLICHFLTAQHGRITVMARGTWRPKGLFGRVWNRCMICRLAGGLVARAWGRWLIHPVFASAVWGSIYHFMGDVLLYTLMHTYYFLSGTNLFILRSNMPAMPLIEAQIGGFFCARILKA